MEKKATQISIKERNIGLILRNIKEGNSITRIKLNSVTGLAKSTISDLVSFLIDKKILFEGKKVDSKLGKKPIILKFNKNIFYIIAVNIGIQYITVAITNLFGEIVTKVKRDNHAKDSRKKILENIFKTIDEAMKKSEIPWEKIYLISIGTHGVVDPATKVVTHAPYFKNWSGINIYQTFAEKYGKDVVVENGVNLGAIGEGWKEYKDTNYLIYLNVNIGVGAGLIINGKLITGKHGSTGEISYLPIMINHDFKKLKKNTLELGFFESQADIVGITNKVRRQASKNIISNRHKIDIEDIDFEYICNFYNDSGNNFIKEIIDNEVLRILAIGIASIITFIDTEVIVINGAIINLGEKFINKLKETIYSIIPFRPKIVTSNLKEDATILGAIKYGINYMDSLFYNQFFSIKF